MTVYQITYRLEKPVDDYDSLHGSVETLGDSIHEKDMCWFVDAEKSAEQIRDTLKKYVLKTDRLLISRVNVDDSDFSASFKNPTTDWLKTVSHS